MSIQKLWHEDGESGWKEALKNIVREAGEMFASVSISEIEQKEGHANFVTNIDREVEEFLQEKLLSLIPGSRMIGEEKENSPLSDAPTWIIDPVDGTTNLIHDYRMSAVSAALCENRRPTVGVVFQPYTKELFYAETGGGAFLNGKPIHAASNGFRKALVAFGTSPYTEELFNRTLTIAGAFLHSCADLRRTGSAALDLAYLAAGRTDIFFELTLKPWDYAAGSLIVQEAGGLFCMPQLEEPDYGIPTAIFASTPVCYEEALALFKKYQ